ncbi:MAG: NADH-quinone oxidoreductase subunit C [Deltaproteobacteria bacterium]|nr:MAG: NADH-quinone oxidoreductase subunit C [Deltaproteobacteria bacterium]
MQKKDLAAQVAEKLSSRVADAVEKVYTDGRGTVVQVKAQKIREVLGALRDDEECPFDFLAHVTAVDWSAWPEGAGSKPADSRFSVIYNLYSIPKRVRLFVEVAVSEGQAVPSATPLYASANWAEREVFDMFGIRFSGHPDLRRILLYDGFEGHPLRKDFPRHGLDPQDHPQEY